MSYPGPEEPSDISANLVECGGGLAFECGCPETCGCSYILGEVLEVKGSKDIIAASCRVISTLDAYGCVRGRPTTRVINGENDPNSMWDIGDPFQYS